MKDVFYRLVAEEVDESELKAGQIFFMESEDQERPIKAVDREMFICKRDSVRLSDGLVNHFVHEARIGSTAPLHHMDIPILDDEL